MMPATALWPQKGDGDEHPVRHLRQVMREGGRVGNMLENLEAGHEVIFLLRLKGEEVLLEADHVRR
ncbi:hypothetical protein D3C85_1926970 [compost metagenome]